MIQHRREIDKMSRFEVSFDVANNDDLAAVRRGDLEPGKVRRMSLQGLVDTGAARLVLPKHAVEMLGLPSTEQVMVKYADGRTSKRPVVEGVYVELQGRHGVYKASVEPNRDTALIGAILLEDFDFLVDCEKKKLVPRNPRYVISECE